MKLSKKQREEEEMVFNFPHSSAELGDYDGRRHSPGYVSEFRLVPNQTKELEQRISEIHQQQLKGVSPTSAELKYLDKVKWHDMYGVDLHPVLVRFLILCKSTQKSRPRSRLSPLHSTIRVHLILWHQIPNGK